MKTAAFFFFFKNPAPPSPASRNSLLSVTLWGALGQEAGLGQGGHDCVGYRTEVPVSERR